MPNGSTVLVFTYSNCGKPRQWRLPTPNSTPKRLSRVSTVRWDRSASIVTMLRAFSLTNGGSIAIRGKRFSSSTAVHIDSGDNTMDTWGWRGQGVKLTIHLHLVPRLRMSGPTPPLPTCLPRVHTEISFVTLTKISCYAVAEAQEMKVRLLLFFKQNEPTSAITSTFSYMRACLYGQAAIVMPEDSDRNSSLWVSCRSEKMRNWVCVNIRMISNPHRRQITLITINSKPLSHSCESLSSLSSQDIPQRAKLVQSTPQPIFKIHFNNILLPTPSTYKWFLCFRFPHQNPLCSRTRTQYVSHVPPSHYRHGHPSNIRQDVQITKLFITHFSPVPCHHPIRRPKHISQRPTAKLLIS